MVRHFGGAAPDPFDYAQDQRSPWASVQRLARAYRLVGLVRCGDGSPSRMQKMRS